MASWLSFKEVWMYATTLRTGIVLSSPFWWRTHCPKRGTKELCFKVLVFQCRPCLFLTIYTRPACSLLEFYALSFIHPFTCSKFNKRTRSPQVVLSKIILLIWTKYFHYWILVFKPWVWSGVLGVVALNKKWSKMCPQFKLSRFYLSNLIDWELSS